ncbi:hypothetical protein ACQUY5_24275 [Bacillus cereus]|uniref:hypothetical protein n=1 Tax=Bacillus cereus TaxID=1396 RepID=UPI003D169349
MNEPLGKVISTERIKHIAKTRNKWEGKLVLHHSFEGNEKKELVETNVSVVPVKTFTGTQFILYNFQGDKMRELSWFMKENKDAGIYVTFLEK